MKALLEMNSTEAATQRRAEREKQKMVEKMNKQEEIRVRNERVKEKRLKELQYELKKDGTELVLEGFDSDDDDVPGANDKGLSEEAKKAAMADAQAERKRRHDERQAREGAFAGDLGDADEGDPILSLPPRAYTNDRSYFLHSKVEDAARDKRLIPSRAQIGYFKPWEHQPEKKQSFVPSTSTRRIIPQDADDCPKPPMIVYDDARDEFTYMMPDEYQMKQAQERERLAQNAVAREKEERMASMRANRQRGPNFDEVDEENRKKEAELPPIQSSWTDNPAEVPLARSRTTIRSIREVQLEKPRFSVADGNAMI